MTARLFMLACVLVAMPDSVSAAVCTSSGSGRWTAVGDASVWDCGTTTNADNFIIASGHRVFVDGTVTVTTGDVTVASGGDLWITAGSTLQPGEFLNVQDGGTYRQLGAKLAECRIRDEIDWSTANPTASLDCPAGTVATTSDYLVFGEEDPDNGEFTGKAVSVGAGLAAPGVYKTSANRYAWYDITALGACPAEATCGNVTYDLDSGTGYAVTPNAPYQGTRGGTLTTAITAANLTFEVQPGRRATKVDVASGHGSVVAVDGDLGSMYLYFEETVANASDPTYCSGKQAKILHTVDGGAGADVLYVAGDVSVCTNATARITPGARRGDLVYLVRPATLNGDVAGAETGHVRIQSGSTIDVAWGRLINLGAMTTTEISPNLGRNCNVCFYQSDTGRTETIAGRIVDSEIAFPATATTDTSVLGFISEVGGNLRYPNDGRLDMSATTFERLHIHDGVDDNATAGTHGVFGDGSKAGFLDGLRVERLSDDGLGYTANVGGGTATDLPTHHIRRALSYEALAEQDNSQQCMEAAQDQNDYDDFDHGMFHLTDSIGVGCFKEAFRLVGTGYHINGLVVGGSLTANSIESSILAGQVGTVDNTEPTRIRNSLLTWYANDGTAVTPHYLILGELYDSVMWGTEQSAAADTGNQYQGFLGWWRSFVHHKGATNYVIEGGAGATNTFKTTRTFEDSALVSETVARVGQNFNTGGATYYLNISRFLYLQTAAWNAAGPNFGPLGGIVNTSGANVDINGLVASTATASTTNFTVSSATAATLSRICSESTDDVTNFVGGTQDAATLFAMPRVEPDAADDTELGLLVGFASDSDPCVAYRPQAIGLARVGMAHVVLGDFALEQLYPIYTSRKDLIQVAPTRHIYRTGPRGSL